MEQKAINPSAGTKKEVQIKLRNKDLKTLKLVDLKKISKEIGIKGVSNLKKDSIIDLIEKSISEKVTIKKSSTAKKSSAKKSKNYPLQRNPLQRNLMQRNHC